MLQEERVNETIREAERHSGGKSEVQKEGHGSLGRGENTARLRKRPAIAQREPQTGVRKKAGRVGEDRKWAGREADREMEAARERQAQTVSKKGQR